jgi:hypothetical protein
MQKSGRGSSGMLMNVYTLFLACYNENNPIKNPPHNYN